MNKFYYYVRSSGITPSRVIVSALPIEFATIPIAGFHYQSFTFDKSLLNDLKSMCATPAKALLYLAHDDDHIREIAKMMLKCKSPVEVRMFGDLRYE